MLQSYLWPVEKVKVGDHLVTCAAKVPENFKFFMHLTLTGAAQVFRRKLGFCPNLGGGVCVCVCVVLRNTNFCEIPQKKMQNLPWN